MANSATTTNTVTRPTRTTDLREKNLARMLHSTATDGSVPPQRPVLKSGPGNGLVGMDDISGTISPTDNLRNKRLDFEVNAPVQSGAGGFERIGSQATVGSVKDAFFAQIPQLRQMMMDETEQLAKRTSALGRTGSGLFNRDTGLVSDRSMASRESLLGNLAFQAVQGDAGRALQAAMSNQGAGVSMSGINAQIASANAARRLQVDLAKQAHLNALQSREDQLARDAMQDQWMRMQLLGSGFNGQSGTNATNSVTNTLLDAGSTIGDNAGVINTQVGDLLSGLVQNQPAPRTPNTPGASVLGRPLDFDTLGRGA